MQNVITLTTDFGLSEYVAAMKGVILTINPDARIVDISHTISPQGIIEGAYVLYSTASYFPRAVHVGVVDPGVGTERIGLVLECENCYLVGPDNGLLIPCAIKMGLKRAFRISDQKYLLKEVTDTFHGRDIFAPVAAHISKGVSISEIGEEIEEYVELHLKHHVKHDDMLEGNIIFVDRFGNMITSLDKEIISECFDFGSLLKIELVNKDNRIKKEMNFLKSYGFGEKGELITTISSSGFFEIAVNQGSAKDTLGAKQGDLIRIKI